MGYVHHKKDDDNLAITRKSCSAAHKVGTKPARRMPYKVQTNASPPKLRSEPADIPILVTGRSSQLTQSIPLKLELEAVAYKPHAA